MIGQLAISALLVLAGLATLLSTAVLGFFTSRVPSGSDAMGLVVPLGLTALGGLAGLVATMWVAGRGGLDGIVAGRLHPMAAALVAGLAIGFATCGAFLGWAEKHWLAHPVLLVFSGLILPLCYFVWLLLITWSPTDAAPTPAAKGLAVMATLAVLAGLMTAALCAQSWWVQAARDHQSHLEHAAAEKAEADRREALGAEGRLREDLSKFSPDAPLWTLVAGLPTETSAELRALWIERALQVPNFEQELQRTWTGEHGVYRHGCAALMIEIPDARLRAEAWTPWLLKDAELTAEDIRHFGNLNEHGYDDLGQHVLSLIRASARLGARATMRPAFERLREAVLATPADPERERVLQALASALATP